KNAPPPRTHEVTRPSTGAAGVDKPPATGAQTAASDEGLADSGRAGTAVSDPARAIEHTGVSDRAGAGGQSAAAKLAKGAEVIEQGGRELAKVSRLRPVARLFLKGARVGAKIGRFVFFVLDVANPILDLLLMVDIVDAFVAWLQREKVAEQAEWRRIAHFLSAHSTTVPLAPFNLPYY